MDRAVQKIKILAGFVVWLTCLGCSEAITDDKLIGRYHLKNCNDWNVNDTLVILSDHQYIHKIQCDNGEKHTFTGTWTRDSNWISFDNFFFLKYNCRSHLPRGNWYCRVYDEDDGIKIMYSSDENIHYFKKAQ